MASTYTGSFYFQLSFGDELIYFQEVSGISNELNIEGMSSAEDARVMYHLPKAQASQNLILKKALVSQGSQFMKWCTDVIDSGLAQPVTTKNMLLSLLDADGKVCAAWQVDDAYPVKYASTRLKRQENGIVLEEVEFAYNTITVVPN